jgi:hypothetical protein
MNWFAMGTELVLIVLLVVGLHDLETVTIAVKMYGPSRRLKPYPTRHERSFNFQLSGISPSVKSFWTPCPWPVESLATKFLET